MSPRLAVAASLLVSLLAVPVSSTAQTRTADLRLFTTVSDQINRYTQYTIFDSISASVADGHVVLSGWVTMPYKIEDVARRVGRIDGVRSVENGLQVLPVSRFDDELRFRIARAIYGHSAFWQYASMVNPPIHIVVNRGRVTLEGVVDSNVDRLLARSLAAGFGAFEVANRLRTDAEMREVLASEEH